MKHHEKKSIFLTVLSPSLGKYYPTKYGCVNYLHANPEFLYQLRFSWFPPDSGKKMLFTLLCRVSEKNNAACTKHRRTGTNHGTGIVFALQEDNDGCGTSHTTTQVNQQLTLCCPIRKAAFPTETRLDAFIFWVCFQPWLQNPRRCTSTLSPPLLTHSFESTSPKHTRPLLKFIPKHHLKTDTHPQVSKGHNTFAMFYKANLKSLLNPKEQNWNCASGHCGLTEFKSQCKTQKAPVQHIILLPDYGWIMFILKTIFRQGLFDKHLKINRKKSQCFYISVFLLVV